LFRNPRNWEKALGGFKQGYLGPFQKEGNPKKGGLGILISGKKVGLIPKAKAVLTIFNPNFKEKDGQKGLNYPLILKLPLKL